MADEAGGNGVIPAPVYDNSRTRSDFPAFTVTARAGVLVVCVEGRTSVVEETKIRRRKVEIVPCPGE